MKERDKRSSHVNSKKNTYKQRTDGRTYMTKQLEDFWKYANVPKSVWVLVNSPAKKKGAFFRKSEIAECVHFHCVNTTYLVITELYNLSVLQAQVIIAGRYFLIG